MGSRYGEVYAQWRADPQGFWAKAAEGIDWIRPPRTIFDAEAGVYGRWFPDATLERLLQRRRPPCRGRPRRSGGDLLRQPGHPFEASHQLSRAAGRGGDARRGARRSRRRQGRPRHRLHADDPRGAVRHARLRAHRRGPFGSVRRLRRQGARDPHRRRRAQAGADGELRRRARPPGRIQAAARSRHRPRQAQAAGLRRLPAAATRGQDVRRPRPRLGGAGRRDACGRQARALRRTRRHRPALHSLHLGDDRNAQGRGARHRRLLRRAEMVDERDLRRRAGRDLLGGFRHRLGGRPFLHRLCAAAARLRDCALRRQADRHARRRRVLAR